MTLQPGPLLQRSTGHAEVVLGADGRLQRLHQRGSAKVFHLPGPEITFLNTSGGLTGGDRMALRLALAPKGRALASTQTAERAYRAGRGHGAGGHPA